jgi:hypothetical protein
LESLKRKRKTSERISDVELQAASSLAQMSRKKLKKAVKKVSSSGVRWVPSAFGDDVFVGVDSQKGSCFWPLLRFNFRDNCSSGSKNESVDILFQMLLPKFARRLYLSLLLKPLLLLGPLLLLKSPLLPKPLLLLKSRC